MGRLVGGEWLHDELPVDDEGHFIRTASTFRNWVRSEPDAPHPVVADRYHLFVSWACPWAHRVLIGRELLGLGDVISLSVADAYMDAEGWTFAEAGSDGPKDLEDFERLWEVYVRADPEVTSRATVPVLWDRQAQTIVNNESREILRMLSTEFTAMHREGAPQLCPPDLRESIDETIDAIYDPINNGVYRSGFARTQAAYEDAVGELFRALDHWEGVLSKQRWLCGDRFTEADICLFTTLLRFDPVYVTHFKCNLRRIADYPALWGFTRDVYQIPGVAATVDLDDIKTHYYTSHPSVNPHGIVPVGPVVDLSEPAGREGLGG